MANPTQNEKHVTLEFNAIYHSYGANPALRGVSLRAQSESITCLLGPSGCGKTTLLHLAAGLMPVQSGEIHVGGTCLSSPSMTVPSEKRSVGLVFQDGALFPHLDIADNIAFGLSKRATSAGERAARVAELLEQAGLSNHQSRMPDSLSGGQKQRIALARALAPAPKVLLMDEPFANVDIVMRRTLRRQVRLMLKAQQTTTILVTHDPEEALEMADNIAVIKDGKIEQYGPPDALYRVPQSLTVAQMIGDGETLKATRDGDILKTPFGDWSAACISGLLPDTESICLVIRPQAIQIKPQDIIPRNITPQKKHGSASGGRVKDVHVMGAFTQIVVESANGQTDITLRTEPDFNLHVGTAVTLTPRLHSIFAFPDTR